MRQFEHLIGHRDVRNHASEHRNRLPDIKQTVVAVLTEWREAQKHRSRFRSWSSNREIASTRQLNRAAWDRSAGAQCVRLFQQPHWRRSLLSRPYRSWLARAWRSADAVSPAGKR